MRAASLSSKKKKSSQVLAGYCPIISPQEYFCPSDQGSSWIQIKSAQLSHILTSFQTVHVLLNLHRTIHTLEQATIIFMKEQTVCYFHNYLIAYKMSENGQNVHYNFPVPRVLLSLSDQQSKNPNIFGLLSYKTHKANL